MGPYLGTPNTAKDSEHGENGVCRWGATSMQGWRKSQEDSHIAHMDLPDNVQCFGVFDGHGGKEVAIFVKDKFCEELVKLDAYKSKNYGEALRQCFRRMDIMLEEPDGQAQLRRIMDSTGSNADPFMMPNREDNIAQLTGCTATVVLITPTHFICANAGDSRTVLGRSSGPAMCFPLSDDHKPDNEPERARIAAAGGFVEENRVNGSLNLSRSIGDFEYKSKPNLPYTEQMVTVDPEVRTVERQDADQFIMMACDGIWDCVTSEQGISQMRSALGGLKPGEQISKCIEELFDRIIATDIISSAGVGTDNMTCVVIQLKQSQK